MPKRRFSNMQPGRNSSSGSLTLLLSLAALTPGQLPGFVDGSGTEIGCCGLGESALAKLPMNTF